MTNYNSNRRQNRDSNFYSEIIPVTERRFKFIDAYPFVKKVVNEHKLRHSMYSTQKLSLCVNLIEIYNSDGLVLVTQSISRGGKSVIGLDRSNYARFMDKYEEVLRNSDLGHFSKYDFLFKTVYNNDLSTELGCQRLAFLPVESVKEFISLLSTKTSLNYFNLCGIHSVQLKLTTTTHDVRFIFY